jgi:DNA mismatch endonuclease (patch repair protein)
MVDVHTPEQRSLNMSRVRSKDTKPELFVRRLLHKLGYRYRLHRKELPGRPDIVFAGRRKVIFVHGCFWHSHQCRFGTVRPASNSDFWDKKRGDTIRRDDRNVAKLSDEGWDVLTVWECQIANRETLAKTLRAFLDHAGSRG